MSQEKKYSHINSRFLLDECITIHWPYNVGDLHDYIRSVDIIGNRAKDEEVFALAMKLNRILVTSDMKFTLRVLLRNHPVYFQKMNGERYLIEPKVEKMENVGECDDYVTQFLVDTGRIITP